MWFKLLYGALLAVPCAQTQACATGSHLLFGCVCVQNIALPKCGASVLLEAKFQKGLRFSGDLFVRHNEIKLWKFSETRFLDNNFCILSLLY